MFEIYIDGRNYPKDGVGFAVILKYGNHVWKRAIKCPKMTTNQAELKALVYAIQSIKSNFHDKEVKIITKNKYIHLMLSRNNEGWVKPIEVIESNRDLIVSVRTFLERHKFLITYNQNDPIFVETNKMVEAAIKGNENIFIKA